MDIACSDLAACTENELGSSHSPSTLDKC